MQKMISKFPLRKVSIFETMLTKETAIKQMGHPVNARGNAYRYESPCTF